MSSRKRRLTNSGGTSGSNSDQSRCEWIQRPLESAPGEVTALIKHYEQPEDVKDQIKDLKPQLARFKQNITTTTIDGDPEETGRRKELTSALKEIEERSQELLTKGTAAQFLDKDSGEVAGLVERLREAITHYQVSGKRFVATNRAQIGGQISQQQAICDQIANLSSSLGTLLELHEKSPAVKNKLDSVMARLDRLWSEEDNDDGLWDENERKHRAELFDTLRLINDKGNTLYNRINGQGYNESQDDVQAASAMADDIRDAIVDYQMAQQRTIYDMNCRLIDAGPVLPSFPLNQTHPSTIQRIYRY
ncbi:hypothetical protein BDM02DRAFT_3263177 [Thelephora ganbajun]|uniref:Uncharacterized protein n=1 Tax=Thelephora ganbajun TaxID=370292 RepID=A0ACB6Z679_THEGA|nr:hypothetical protein BDM02DRAFT_3263177 [Thelephora ganbajun]